MAHCKAALARYKYPRWLRYVDALPKTATGKIQRYKLRDGEVSPYNFPFPSSSAQPNVCFISAFRLGSGHVTLRAGTGCHE